MHTHIDRVRIKRDTGDSLGATEEHSRQDIVAGIRDGETFVTIFRNNDGKWERGQPVFIVRINGTDYIKTVDNGKAVDNLDNLPEF